MNFFSKLTRQNTTSCVRSNIDPQVEITYTSAPKKRVLADYFVLAVPIFIAIYFRISIYESHTQRGQRNSGEGSSVPHIGLRQNHRDHGQRIIFFTWCGRLDSLHEALQSVLNNESSQNITIVHLYNRAENNEEGAIKEALSVHKQIFLPLEVGRVARQGELGPPMVDSLSRGYGVLKNSMFFGAPEDMHNFSLEQLGDVRIIFGRMPLF